MRGIAELAGVVGQVAQGREEAGGGVLVVGVRELCADAPVVEEAGVDVMVGAQPVGGAVAGGVEFGDVDDDPEGIEVDGRRADPAVTGTPPGMRRLPVRLVTRCASRRRR
ncbi:hypothetical protein ACWGJB_41035 [Streptomyces sp. NPDC054813]